MMVLDILLTVRMGIPVVVVMVVILVFDVEMCGSADVEINRSQRLKRHH